VRLPFNKGEIMTISIQNVEVKKVITSLKEEVKELKLVVKKQKEHLMIYEDQDRIVESMIDKVRGK